jgi:hypothetical protein
VNQPVSKSSLPKAQSDLVDLCQQHPFSRIECLLVRNGEPVFSPPPKIIQKLRMGSDNGPRPESTLPDFWLKKQLVELLETIAELGDGEIRSIEIAHGLPLLVGIERRPVFDQECTHV